MLFGFAVGVITAAILTPIAREALKRFGVLDVPNDRSSHVVTVVRGGGVAVAVATLLAVAASPISFDAPLWGLIGAASALGVIGFVDDRSGLTAVPRLVAQVVVPALALPLLVSGSTRSGVAATVAVGIAIIWSAAYVNAFNFMDGINGISVAQAAVAGGFFAMVGDVYDLSTLKAAGLAIAGAAIGFAPFNIWRPSVFLGDVGSYFIGSWLASLVVVAIAQGVNPLIAVSPLMLYLADTSTTILRRAIRRENLLAAHREHSYQRLVQLGWSHAAVSLLATVVMAATAAMMLAARTSSSILLVGVFATATLVALAFCLLPNALERIDPVPSP